MKRLFAITLICLPLIAHSAGTKQSDKPISKFIQTQARKTGSSEYPDARQIVKGDVSRDGTEDTVVLYTLEGFHGNNNYQQYLAVFTMSRSGLRYRTHRQIGGKGWRDVDLLAITNGAIQLATKEYAETDANCCPSVTGSARLVLRGRHLKEAK